ncbi:MAG TPA: DUF177 domain-containing protein [Armatimonadota bacterium]|jgi:uncharacterized protein
MPVQLDLSELLHTPGMRVPCDVDVPCDSDLELDCEGSVPGRLVFTNTGNLLVVQGSVTVTLKTQCPRCLAETAQPREVPVDDEFTVYEDHVTGRADDDEGFADPALTALWQEGHILNLTELVRQSIVLEFPVEPLCREDCKGLCPVCGCNRNEKECDCAPPVVSPFAVLAGLYKQDAD